MNRPLGLGAVMDALGAAQPAIEHRVAAERDAERRQGADRLEAITRAALRARQVLANLDADRSAEALSQALSGAKHELDEILALVGPLPEEWRRVVAPTLPPSTREGDPELF